MGMLEPLENIENQARSLIFILIFHSNYYLVYRKGNIRLDRLATIRMLVFEPNHPSLKSRIS